LKIQVPLLIAFARSGGTLVNQLLGAHPDVLILSEVNPAGEAEPISWQERKWLGLMRFWERRSFGKLAFIDKIQLLAERAQKKEKTLMVRDWSMINFIKTSRIQGPYPPSGLLESREVLKSHGILGPELVVTRRYPALLRSIRRTFPEFAQMPEGIFASAYLTYARAAAALPIIHLEDLRADPETALRKVFDLFHITPVHIPEVLRNFSQFKKCTGNNTAESQPSSASFAEIQRNDLEEKDELPICPEAKEADQIFGYR